MTMAKEEPRTRKARRLNIRLTEEDYRLLSEKAQRYPSISSLVLDSVRNFDIRRGRNRLDTMIEFSENVKGVEVELSRIGNNINQIAKELHRYRIEGRNLSLTPLDGLILGVDDANKTLGSLKKLLSRISRGEVQAVEQQGNEDL
jgi:hypothetical protein